MKMNEQKQNKKTPFPDFIKLLAYRSKLSEKTVRKVYSELINLIEDELKMNNLVYLRGLGVISLKYIEAQDRYIPNRQTGCSTKHYCEPTIMLHMNFSKALKDKIKNYINNSVEIKTESTKRIKQDEIRTILVERYGFDCNDIIPIEKKEEPQEESAKLEDYEKDLVFDINNDNEDNWEDEDSDNTDFNGGKDGR
jgi:nucleoid DNA-binding protein